MQRIAVVVVAGVTTVSGMEGRVGRIYESIGVVAITAQRGCIVSGGTAYSDAYCGAVAIVVEVLVPGRAAGRAFLVREAIAVVIGTITRLFCPRVGAAVDVVAVCAVEDVP